MSALSGLLSGFMVKKHLQSICNYCAFCNNDKTLDGNTVYHHFPLPALHPLAEQISVCQLQTEDGWLQL